MGGSMTVYNYILAFMSAGCFFFGIYYLLAVIYIHKKIFDKHFYFLIACFACSLYILSQLLLSLKFSDEQYVFFHNLKAISVFIVTPTFFLSFYDIFFPSAKKIILHILILFLPIQIILAIFGFCFTLPVRLVEINTPISVFIYHLGTSNIGYLFWVFPTGSAVFLSIIYYFFSKQKGKRIQFVIIMILMIFILANDTSISRGLINSLYLAEYSYFILIAAIFLEFLKEDRKTYLSVVNLSKELQKHKEELEIKVEERTRELSIEKEKSDQLLLNVLPEQIANRLKKGETPIADHFEEASVVFIDIADFTKLSAKSTPQKMVNMLNDIFSIFDKISAKYGLEKIKTIGDCYMAAAGIPVPRADHAEAISKMAIEIMQTMKDYRTEDGNEIKFRIGLDCGPIVAGVIGEQKFIYDLWGDMVNTASRMETNGIIDRIQCTERFKEKLSVDSSQLPDKNQGKHILATGNRQPTTGNRQLTTIFEERGEIEIKGKGKMRTYFLENNHRDIL
jgi:class 3 adenylate cyclase